YETDGKTFRYYNSFCCPHCGTAYIDYKHKPELKHFGVSACVHLGRKLYRTDGPLRIDPYGDEPEGSPETDASDRNDLFPGQCPEIPDDEEDYEYTVIDGDEIIIKRYLGSKQDPVIPRCIGGHQVTAIGVHAFLGTDIESVSIPEGVFTIEREAFAACEELTKVLLPSTLKNFGKGAFKGSEKLRDVSFRGKNSDFTVKDGIVYDTEQRKLLLCPPGLELRRVDVVPGTVIIGDSAFFTNKTLEIVNLPMSVRTIEDSAFLFTRSLRIIELPPFIENISDKAFLFGAEPFREKHFEIYAFPGTYAYQYAEKNRIPVNPLYGIITG
ncbi:MAG: leucine-rich repeat domain-containing protein, partial [Anaerolineaceae bacterium]|nr:leucine-rich repeat domain-containing protein [Anaerolineaceae bacterium]